ncbi:MAG: Serine/threonine-protein kinase PknD [Planctomycetes bacterium]|nr:Serine/threonine-protein kinase PknD [Planctomycetota bacterium]
MELGPYRLDRELGSGGMGKVWSASVVGDAPGLRRGDVVALKIVHPHLLESPQFLQRFLREAQIGQAVVHENVVRTFDCASVEHDGKRVDFLTMEYVEGRTLRELLEELERVPEELCRHIGREVAKGLAAIHAAGVIHRDMKPENVLITKDHVVKVMDLGVARLVDDAARLSQTGSFVGSIHYAAPECFTDGGKSVDGRADLHALGLVLYELACGVNPYFADAIAQILRKVLHEEPRRLGDANPQLSPFYEEAVHCLLAKDPGARFPDAASLAEALERGEESVWWTARARALVEATRKPLRRIRVPRETAVYGREADLATLRGLWEKVRGGDAQIVLVEGEAGIGKSRVVDELVGRLQRDGEDLNFLFGSYPPGGAATAIGAFATAFREQFGEAGLEDAVRGRLGAAATLAPAFAALLTGAPPPPGSEPLARDSIQSCFVAAARSLAADRPTVLLIDDLHFAPDEARALFAALALAAPGHRILLVGTARPGVDERWLASIRSLQNAHRMPLARLGPKDLAELLADSFKSEHLAAQLGHRIAVKSDGNPFFAFEIIRGLRENHLIALRADGTWASTQAIAEISIPSTVMDLVNARVAGLDEAERNLLDVASCLGFEFDASLAGAALGIGRIPALQTFARVEKRDRLVRASGRNFIFDHHQVQEALYGALPEMLREEYHAALGEAIEARTGAASKDVSQLDGALAADLCGHFLSGAQGDRARRYLDAAFTHFERTFANEAAVKLAERALAVPDLLAGAERARLLVRMTGRLDLLGRRAAQRAAAEEALALFRSLGDRKGEAAALLALGGALLLESRIEEARRCAEDALAISRAEGDPLGESSALQSLGSAVQAMGYPAEAVPHYERALVLCRETGNRRGEAVTLGSLGIAVHTLGRFDDARGYHEAHLSISREIGYRRGEAPATGNLGNAWHSLGRLAEARDCYERHLAIAREVGIRRGEGISTGNLGSIALMEGRLDDAESNASRFLEISREVAYRVGEASALATLADVRSARGDDDGALALLRESLDLLAKSGAKGAAAGVRISIASILVDRRDADAARALLDAALAQGIASGSPDLETMALCHLALLPGGDGARAEERTLVHEPRLAMHERMRARFLLWRAGRGDAHLAEAKRLLDASLAGRPEEVRASTLARFPLCRDIAAASAA